MEFPCKQVANEKVQGGRKWGLREENQPVPSKTRAKGAAERRLHPESKSMKEADPMNVRL